MDVAATEIGRRLNIPPATVRWRLAKALSEIRGRFGEESAAVPEEPPGAGLGEELLARVRELALLAAKMEELAGEGTAFSVKNFLPGATWTA